MSDADATRVSRPPKMKSKRCSRLRRETESHGRFTLPDERRLVVPSPKLGAERRGLYRLCRGRASATPSRHSVTICEWRGYPARPLQYTRLRTAENFQALDRTPPELYWMPPLRLELRRNLGRKGHNLEEARSSVVEHYLDTVGVVGSIPIAPTRLGLTSQGISRGSAA